jgi:dTDP-4-amino-4,6-dideoxygalactose transaminase
VGNRDEIGGALAAVGVATGIHYARTVPAQQPFGSRQGFPVAERWAATELSLPMFEHLREDEIERVARELIARC